MDFEFSQDQEMLRDSVRRFLSERAPISWVREHYDDPRGTTDEVWKGVVDLGLTGILVPEEHGGLGMGMVDMGVVLEEMGRAVHPGPFLPSAVGAVSLADAELLPDLASGEVTGAAAIEGDPLHLDGSSVSGVKHAVLAAEAADVVLVDAADGSGAVVVAVETGAPGVSIEAVEGVDGTRRMADIHVDGASARRVELADAEAALAEARDRVVTGLTVDGVGAAAAALDMSVEYAKERRQFDHPIGSFQAVQHLCADMLYDLELARAGAYYALWACDEADAATRHEAATMAKAWASDALFRVGANTIQVHGGIGFTWEHDAHLFYKRLLTLQQAFGGTTRHLEELARLALD